MRAGGRGLRRPLERESVVDVDDHEVEAVEAAGAQHLARRPRRRANGSLRPSERGDAYARSSPTGKSRSSRMRSISVPTMPGRTHQADFARRPAHSARLRSSPNAVCSACTARSTSSSATTHEMRMVDVLIISMLMPSVGEHLEHLGRDAGVRLHARADERDPADALVGAEARWPRSRRRSSPCTPSARERSARGTVNEMSVWPAVETFCTIMSTLTPASASARNHVAATPGRSGTCSIVTLASDDVVRDAGDDRLLHRCHRRVLLGDPGAGRPGEARTHVHAHAVVARELDRPQREHAAAGRGHLEHLVERDARELARRRARSAGRRCTRLRRRCRSRTRRRRARPPSATAVSVGAAAARAW